MWRNGIENEIDYSKRHANLKLQETPFTLHCVSNHANSEFSIIPISDGYVFPFTFVSLPDEWIQMKHIGTTCQVPIKVGIPQWKKIL